MLILGVHQFFTRKKIASEYEKHMENILKKIINSIQDIRNEEKNLLKFISFLKLSPEQKILDIGCGYGRNLKLLYSHRFNVLGVDVNQDIVKANLDAGLKCMTVQEFEKTNNMYDVLLMSHIIEHFQSNELIKFIDTYLDRLKVGGYLIIATPLYSPYFYEDFDHVKPYHPTGINMVFGNNSAQVQYYSKNKIELLDIWFRKGPFKLNFSPGLYVRKYSRIPMIINLMFAILFRLSFGLIARTDGWMGFYRKVS